MAGLVVEHPVAQVVVVVPWSIAEVAVSMTVTIPVESSRPTASRAFSTPPTVKVSVSTAAAERAAMAASRATSPARAPALPSMRAPEKSSCTRPFSSSRCEEGRRAPFSRDRIPVVPVARLQAPLASVVTGVAGDFRSATLTPANPDPEGSLTVPERLAAPAPFRAASSRGMVIMGSLLRGVGGIVLVMVSAVPSSSPAVRSGHPAKTPGPNQGLKRGRRCAATGSLGRNARSGPSRRWPGS